MTDKIRKKIYADFKAGDSISTVMKRYDLSKSTVARLKGILLIEKWKNKTLNLKQ